MRTVKHQCIFREGNMIIPEESIWDIIIKN